MRKGVILAAVSCVLLAVVAFFVNLYIGPAIKRQAEMQVLGIGQSVLNDALKRTLDTADFTNLVIVQRDEAGDIQLVTVNSKEINNIENIALTYAQDKLSSMEKTGVSVNVGSALSTLTTGLGPDIKIGVQPRGAAQATYYTRFETGGVNQTRHKIYIRLKADLRVLVGLSVLDVEVRNDLLICETIIVGKVPESYIDVNNKEDLLNLLPAGN
jgi:sporulation protein YunB